MNKHSALALFLIGFAAVACDDSTSGGGNGPGSADGGDDEQPGEELIPGAFLSPLPLEQRMQGLIDHLHVDDVALRADGLMAQCAYTFGVVDTRNPEKMKYLAQALKHVIPGDVRQPGCIHLAWDGTSNRVYTTHRGNISNPAFISGWDITTMTSTVPPTQLPVLQEPGVSYEGIDVSNGNIFVGLKQGGLGVYQRDVDNNFVRVGTGTGFINAWGVFARPSDNTIFVADGVGGLVSVDGNDPANPTIIGRVVTGGDARDVVVSTGFWGKYAYVSLGSGGVAVIDISDLANMKVISRIEMPGSALRAAYSQGFLSVAAWNDLRVYDVSNPSAPRFIGAARLSQDDGDFNDDNRPASTMRILGVAMRGRDVFAGSWWVLHSFHINPQNLAPNIRLPESAMQTDFGPVDVGAKKTIPLAVTNQGTAPLTMYNNFVLGDAYSVSPQQMRLQPGETGALQLTFTPTTGRLQVGYLNIVSDDPDQPVRKAYLVGNQPGLGIGVPMPETHATLIADSSDWYSSQTTGKVLLLGYWATF